MIEQGVDTVDKFGAAVCFATFSGLVSYCVKASAKQSFRWSEFVFQVASSAIAGVISYQVMVELCGASPNLSAALCGVAGWMGTNAFKIFEFIFLRRFGVDAKTIATIEQGAANNQTQQQTEEKKEGAKNE